jgi:hypothetical protein
MIFEHRKLPFFLVAILGLVAGCADDPSLYQGEKLILETPVSSKEVKKKQVEKNLSIDLGADEKSNFHITRIGAFVPWGPYPVFDYYLEPFPVEVPVSPDFSLIDYVHPFYAFAQFNPFSDDDDGLFFRPDDD